MISTLSFFRRLPPTCLPKLFPPSFLPTASFHASFRLEQKLTVGLNKKGGRGRYGHKTVGRQGGGHKQKYRIVDFRRIGLQSGAESREKVLAIEYDPCRTARLALVAGSRRKYILAPDGIKVGDVITATRIKPEKLALQAGNAYRLRDIPLGQAVHNVELRVGKGGQAVRSAGSFAVVQQKSDGGSGVVLKLPSGQLKTVKGDCVATLGRLSNVEHRNRVIGKAGRSRWLGIRPKPNKQKKLRKKKEGV